MKNLVKNTLYFYVLVIFNFSCQNENTVSSSVKEERLKTAMVKLEEESQNRHDFFEKGGVNLVKREFNMPFKSPEQAEAFYDSYLEQNKESPYLKDYKPLFANILISKFDLSSANDIQKKQRFVKYFNSILQEKGGNYKQQAEFLRKSKPYLSSEQYQNFVIGVENTKKENKENIENVIKLVEKAMEKEQNPEKIRKAKVFIKIQKKLLMDLE